MNFEFSEFLIILTIFCWILTEIWLNSDVQSFEWFGRSAIRSAFTPVRDARSARVLGAGRRSPRPWPLHCRKGHLVLCAGGLRNVTHPVLELTRRQRTRTQTTCILVSLNTSHPNSAHLRENMWRLLFELATSADILMKKMLTKFSRSSYCFPQVEQITDQ